MSNSAATSAYVRRVRSSSDSVARWSGGRSSSRLIEDLPRRAGAQERTVAAQL